MEKRIQIPLVLYEMMVEYIQNHYDPNDQQHYSKILRGIEEKKEAEIRHNIYSAYKNQTDPSVRETLRQSYLDKVGIPSHGRWDEESKQKFHDIDF